MDENSKKKRKLFAERGSYIALFICVAIVGIASWILLYQNIGPGEETPAISVQNEADYDVQDVIRVPESKSPEQKEEPEAEEKTDVPDDEAGEVSVGSSEDEDEPVEPGDGETEDDGDDEVTVRYVWPLAGAVEVSYSMNELIYDKTMADWRTHDGVDIAAQLGTKVLAVADGRVEKVYDDDMYGTTVIISHADGMRSVYSNLAGKPTVTEGDTVSCGDIIGSVGATAAAETGEVNHLHFGMKLDGKSVDPTEYLPKR